MENFGNLGNEVAVVKKKKTTKLLGNKLDYFWMVDKEFWGGDLVPK